MTSPCNWKCKTLMFQRTNIPIHRRIPCPAKSFVFLLVISFKSSTIHRIFHNSALPILHIFPCLVIVQRCLIFHHITAFLFERQMLDGLVDTAVTAQVGSGSVHLELSQYFYIKLKPRIITHDVVYVNLIKL